METALAFSLAISLSTAAETMELYPQFPSYGDCAKVVAWCVKETCDIDHEITRAQSLLSGWDLEIELPAINVLRERQRGLNEAREVWYCAWWLKTVLSETYPLFVQTVHHKLRSMLSEDDFERGRLPLPYAR
jgi:hypothetical protein